MLKKTIYNLSNIILCFMGVTFVIQSSLFAQQRGLASYTSGGVSEFYVSSVVHFLQADVNKVNYEDISTSSYEVYNNKSSIFLRETNNYIYEANFKNKQSYLVTDIGIINSTPDGRYTALITAISKNRNEFTTARVLGIKLDLIDLKTGSLVLSRNVSVGDIAINFNQSEVLTGPSELILKNRDVLNKLKKAMQDENRNETIDYQNFKLKLVFISEPTVSFNSSNTFNKFEPFRLVLDVDSQVFKKMMLNKKPSFMGQFTDKIVNFTKNTKVYKFCSRVFSS